MQDSGLIPAYAELLAGKLSFDRALSRAVRQEVEDHLYEAAASMPDGDDLAAERRAIGDFGDPDAIAAQLAAVSLARQTRKVSAAVVLVIGGVFLAMKARVVWYGITHWALGEDVKTAVWVIGRIDAFAFWLAVAIGLAGCIYISATATPSGLAAYRKQVGRFFLLSRLATWILITVVISDGLLTVLRIYGVMSAEALVPIVSMVVEIVCAGLLIALLRGLMQRIRAATALAAASPSHTAYG